MLTTQFDALARTLAEGRSRRRLFGFIAGSGLTWMGLASVDAKKKRKKKRKKKKKCGKAGGKPVRGNCCTRTVLVDGTCRTCDVCASGCQYSSIQAAIDAASAGDSIAICPGAYAGNLMITKDVRLIGAGDGAGAGNTIVRGSGDGSVVRVETSVVRLEHLRITGGNSVGGGGVYNAGGALVLVGCTVIGNAAQSGGGIFNTGTLSLTRCTVSGNTADGGGGLANSVGGMVDFDPASRVTGNTATVTGGGIHNNGAVTLASSANVSGNTPNNCAGTVAVPLCSG